MTTDNTQQDPISEFEPVNEAELSEETLEKMSGGIGLFNVHPKRRLPKKPLITDEPKEGGATGSW